MILRKFWPLVALLAVGLIYFMSGDDEPEHKVQPPQQASREKPADTRAYRPVQPDKSWQDQYGYRPPAQNQARGYPYAPPGSSYQQPMTGGEQYQFRPPETVPSKPAPFPDSYSSYPQADGYSYSQPAPGQSYPSSDYYGAPGPHGGYRFRPQEKKESQKRWEGNFQPPRLPRYQSPKSNLPYEVRPDPYNQSLPGGSYDPLWANSEPRR